MKLVLGMIGAVTVLAQCLASGQGADMIIKQHAKELNNQNNVRQGIAPPTKPAQPPPSSGATQPPVQSQSLIKLQSDIAAFKADVPVTAAQKQALADDFIAVAQGAKP